MLCTEKMDLVTAFYEAAGVQLEKEQHGAGPQHFSFKTDICIELYPPRVPADASFVLRIDVKDLDETMAKIQSLFSYSDLIVQDTQSLSSGKKSILRDPDGRIVELFQPKAPY
jgi:lactoylglutathione lyase